VVVAYGSAESKPFETCLILPSLLGKQIQGTKWVSFDASDIAPSKALVLPQFWETGRSIPPQGIHDKDLEPNFAQVCTIVQGDPKKIALYFGNPKDVMSDTLTEEPFLLSPGDVFLVPPFNTIRIENHSELVDCVFGWTFVNTMPYKATVTSLAETLNIVPRQN